MNKKEFLEELEYLLQDLSEEDREDGIAYYRDYLEEAGEDQEEDVLKAFGSPERIASIIRSNLKGDLEDGGSFTEAGFEDERFRNPGYQMERRKDLPDVYEEVNQHGPEPKQSAHTEGKRPRVRGILEHITIGKTLLLLALIFILSPVILGLGSGAVAVVCGLFGTVLATVVGIGFLTALACFGTVILAVVGLGMIFSNFWGGVTVAGFAIFTMGCAFIGIALSIVIYGTFLPWCIRTFVNALGRLIHGGKKKHEKIR